MKEKAAEAGTKKQKIRKERIWELDFIRGLAIIGVVFIHVVFDAKEIFKFQIDLGPVFDAVQQYGGVIFIVLSGVCVTLGRNNLKRGLIVLGCGIAVSGVTALMIHFGPLSAKEKIDFGVLSCLGACMIIYSLIRKTNKYIILAVGLICMGLGIWFSCITVDTPYLFVLGLREKGYFAGDYFPLMPHLGYFLVGAFLGRTLYVKKRSLLPKVNDRMPFFRQICFIGRHSLWVYLAHQPLAFGILSLISALIAKQ